MRGVSVFFLFLIFLFSYGIDASTMGASGSGKPVVVKLRKDYLEIVLKEKLRSQLSSSDTTIPINYNGSQFDVPVNIDIQKVFLSRGLEKRNGEEERYRIFIFGGIELKKGLLPDYLTEYYNKILLSYRQEINNKQIMIYGYEDVLT